MEEHKENAIQEKNQPTINPIIENTKSSEATDAIEENVLSEYLNKADTSSNVNLLIQKTVASSNFPLVPEEQTKETPEIEENMVTIELNSFNQMVAENNVLQAENKFLKESIQRFENRKLLTLIVSFIIIFCVYAMQPQ